MCDTSIRTLTVNPVFWVKIEATSVSSYKSGVTIEKLLSKSTRAKYSFLFSLVEILM